MKTRTPRWPQGPARALLAVTATAWLLMACSKAPEEVLPAPPPATVGTQIDDTVITASVKTALLADPDVKGLAVEVTTEQGEVRLSGLVDSQLQLDRAAALAAAADGVRRVRNDLRVKP